MNPLKVSISLITYNHGEFIADALESVLTQKVNFLFEIVVGDDKSTDRAPFILQEYAIKYPEIIRLISREENIGSTKNFLETMLACKGQYIANMDGDDVMYPGKLQAQVDYLDNNKECVMVAHDLEEFDTYSNQVLRIIKPKIQKQHYDLRDIIKHGSIFGNSSKMFRRSQIHEKIVNENIKVIADYNFTINLLYDGFIGHIKKNLGGYRIHSDGLMKLANSKDIHDDILLTFESVNEVFGNKYKNDQKNLCSHACLIYGVQEIRNENIKVGRREIFQSIILNPFYGLSSYFYLLLSIMPKTIRKYILTVFSK